jgi:predicted transcriptional regulator
MDFKLHHRKNNFDIAPKDIWIRLRLPDEDAAPLDQRVSLSILEGEENASPDSQIMDMIGNRDPDPVALTEIVASTGLKKETARSALKRLIAAGLVFVASKGGPAESGTYSLTEAGREAGGSK